MDASDSPQRISNLDFERFRLRRFLEALAAAGEVEIVEQQVELADIAATLSGNPKAVWFKKAGPEGA